MDGSNGKIIALLERIADGQDQTNARLDGMQEEIKELIKEVKHLTGEVKQTNARLDNVIGFLGQRYDNHERRIQALEDRVFKQSG